VPTFGADILSFLIHALPDKPIMCETLLANQSVTRLGIVRAELLVAEKSIGKLVVPLLAGWNKGRNGIG